MANEEEPAAAAVRELLASKSRPTALYAASIKLTIGALRALREAGIQVPSEIEIVGFDDIAMADLFSMPVSTVCQDVEAIGREAFRALLKVMNGQKVQREMLLPPRLKVR
jgi:LacI family transcriptional regulator